MKQFTRVIFILCLILTLAPSTLSAQTSDEVIKGKIIKITTEQKDFVGTILPVSVIDVQITSGNLHGQTIPIDQPPSQKDTFFHVGDHVLISASRVVGEEPVYYIVDIIRTKAILVLFLLFIALALIVAGWHGARSLFGLGISFFVLLSVVMPRLFGGRDPVATAVIGALIIAPITFYLTHGVNRKTTIALVGTAIALTVTAILAQVFIVYAKLTGYSSEEVQFLQIARGGSLNPQGLLLAGIIIGALGVLDDVTISQASIVQELKKVNKKLTKSGLFISAMRVGRDHIAATINTLVLVYTGASLPLLLLFLNSSQPFSNLINYELVAVEIIRSLLGSIGLILAVPVTTMIAVFAQSDEDPKIK